MKRQTIQDAKPDGSTYQSTIIDLGSDSERVRVHLSCARHQQLIWVMRVFFAMLISEDALEGHLTAYKDSRIPRFQDLVPRFQVCILPDTTLCPKDWNPTESLLGKSCVYIGNCISNFLMCKHFGPFMTIQTQPKCNIIQAYCQNLVLENAQDLWRSHWAEHQRDD